MGPKKPTPPQKKWVKEEIKEEIKKYLKTNKNENLTFQNYRLEEKQS